MFSKIRYQKCVSDHKDRVFRYAYFTLRNEAEAEDATQEVFIKLWNKFDTIQPLKVKSWLMRTTYNHCIDRIRKYQRTTDKNVEIQEYQSFDIESPSDDDPRRNLENKGLKDRIDQAIAKLPERIKEIFLMYEIQGLKYREIAETLDMPLNTVKVQLMRGRKLLQQELQYENQH